MGERDLRTADALQQGKGVDRWYLPSNPQKLQEIEQVDTYIKNGHWRLAFAEAIRNWARKDAPQLEDSRMRVVLEKAGWCRPVMTLNWITMSEIKSMNDGPERDRKIAQALKESPQSAVWMIISVDSKSP